MVGRLSALLCACTGGDKKAAAEVYGRAEEEEARKKTKNGSNKLQISPSFDKDPGYYYLERPSISPSAPEDQPGGRNKVTDASLYITYGPSPPPAGVL